MSGASTVILTGRDAETRRLRRAVLSSDVIRIFEAASAAELLNLLAAERADLVLLDLDLAEEDGVETYVRLKSHEGFLAPVLLLIPASVAGFARKAALGKAADAYLVEPVEPAALSATVRSMLELSHARRELSTLGERVRALENHLHQAEAEAEQFAAQTCHDIEEPLRAVTTFVELIEDRRDGQLSQDERAYLGHVLAASTRVRYLLRGFLSYSQAGRSRRGHFGPVDLRLVATSAVQSLRQRVEETGAAIQFERSLPAVLGDFSELQQVFKHVIGNAIEYRQPGSAPNLTIGFKRTERDELAILIADNGPGIPADLQSAVFQPFKRLHGREIPGAGMGLAISKRIVESHGGRMWVESAPEKGACFCFTLPAAEASRETAV